MVTHTRSDPRKTIWKRPDTKILVPMADWRLVDRIANLLGSDTAVMLMHPTGAGYGSLFRRRERLIARDPSYEQRFLAYQEAVHPFSPNSVYATMPQPERVLYLRIDDATLEVARQHNIRGAGHLARVIGGIGREHDIGTLVFDDRTGRVDAHALEHHYDTVDHRNGSIMAVDPYPAVPRVDRSQRPEAA